MRAILVTNQFPTLTNVQYGKIRIYQFGVLLSACALVGRLVNTTKYDWVDWCRVVVGLSLLAFRPSNAESWTPIKDAPYRSIMTLVHMRDCGNEIISRTAMYI